MARSVGSAQLRAGSFSAPAARCAIRWVRSGLRSCAAARGPARRDVDDVSDAAHRVTQADGLGHHSVMNRNETLALLAQHKPEVQRRFGVHSLALFGSWAQGQARPSSDVDMLVEFDGPATSTRYFGPLLRPAVLSGRSLGQPGRSRVRRRCARNCVPLSNATRSMSDAAAAADVP